MLSFRSKVRPNHDRTHFGNKWKYWCFAWDRLRLNRVGGESFYRATAEENLFYYLITTVTSLYRQEFEFDSSITFIFVLISFSLQNFEAGDRSNTPADKKERFGAWHSERVSAKLSFKLRQNKNVNEFGMLTAPRLNKSKLASFVIWLTK